jgi:hypothetical protein
VRPQHHADRQKGVQACCVRLHPPAHLSSTAAMSAAASLA